MHTTQKVFLTKWWISHNKKSRFTWFLSPLFPSLTLRLKVDVAHGPYVTFLEHLKPLSGRRHIQPRHSKIVTLSRDSKLNHRSSGTRPPLVIAVTPVCLSIFKFAGYIGESARKNASPPTHSSHGWGGTISSWHGWCYRWLTFTIQRAMALHVHIPTVMLHAANHP